MKTFREFISEAGAAALPAMILRQAWAETKYREGHEDGLQSVEKRYDHEAYHNGYEAGAKKAAKIAQKKKLG